MSLGNLAEWMRDQKTAEPYSELVAEVAVHVRAAGEAAETAHDRFHAGNRFWLETRPA